MQVKVLVSMAGLEHAWAPGQIIDVPAGEAAAMIAAGSAEPLGASSASTPARRPSERAVRAPGATRSKPTPKP